MELQYTIVRSPKRKTLSITVERDRAVVVRAPMATSEETIGRLVDTKRQWLLEKLRHPQKYQERVHPPGKEVVNGESALYLGKEYRIELTETASGQVEFQDAFLIPKTHQENRRRVLREWYIERANETLLPLAENRARQLGVSYASVSIVDTHYRWGSCTPTNRLTFNWRLIKAPMFVVQYVVLHELAHLLEPNHSPRFWNIVRAQVPSLDKARLWLKENGSQLEEDL